MFVCLCNAISDTDLRQVAKNGAKDVDSAYRCFGAEIKCGRCRETAEQILSEESHGLAIDQKPEVIRYWQSSAVQAAE